MLAHQDLCIANVFCINFLSPELWTLQSFAEILTSPSVLECIKKIARKYSQTCAELDVGTAVSNGNCFQLGLLYFQ